MKKLDDVVLKLVTKTAFASAKKEANSACMCLGYQPKMPEKVRKLKTKNG
ncbi:MAG: cyclic lactone autoinducer peptide [Lachnospiraceae bacterium]|nr:cyclic lactone autoinducer peptide [Lachnospiraceae bacterium]